jgi:hypothetical protein
MRPVRRDRRGDVQKSENRVEEVNIGENTTGPMQGPQRTIRDDIQTSGMSQPSRANSPSHAARPESPERGGPLPQVHTIKAAAGVIKTERSAAPKEVIQGRHATACNVHAKPAIFAQNESARGRASIPIPVNYLPVRVRIKGEYSRGIRRRKRCKKRGRNRPK